MPQPMVASMAASEWRAQWPLVLSAMVGLSFGGLPAASLGLFMEPLNAEFGWSSAQVSAGMTVMAVVSLLLAPLAGAVLDRFGSRRVALPGLALSGAAFAAFSLMSGPYLQWLAAWLVLSLAMLFIRMMVWNRAVASAFTASRGMAVAVLLTGLAVGQAAVPPLTNWLIETVGWRNTYVALGLGWTGLAFALVALFFRESASATQRAGQAPLPAALPGLTLREAMRDKALIKIAIATALQTGLAAAVAIHLVPLLVSSGLDRSTGAALAGVLGLFSLVGKLFNGWMIDRYTSGLIPFSAFSMPAIAYVLFWQGASSLPMLAAAAAIAGYSGGASLHMTNYLATRYAGLGHFGKIFGVISSLMGLAAGISPLVAGLIFDSTGSYDLLLIAGVPLALIAGLLVSTLGRYPEFKLPAGIDPLTLQTTGAKPAG
jgi:predicted MFS family arabinose efflux permease